MYKTILIRKLAYLKFLKSKYSYVKYVEGHKNSQGEKAPWCVLEHDTGKILSSFKTEEEATSQLRNMHIHKKGSLDPKKEKELVVWCRLQEGLDKLEIIEFLKKRFKLDDRYAEDIYFKAFPEGLSKEEFTKIEEANKTIENLHLDPSFVYQRMDEAVEQASIKLTTSPIVDIFSTTLLDLLNNPKIF